MRPPIAACLRESLLPQSPNRPAGGPAAKYQGGTYLSGSWHLGCLGRCNFYIFLLGNNCIFMVRASSGCVISL